jgi:hypothetical protein
MLQYDNVYGHKQRPQTISAPPTYTAHRMDRNYANKVAEDNTYTHLVLQALCHFGGDDTPIFYRTFDDSCLF